MTNTTMASALTHPAFMLPVLDHGLGGSQDLPLDLTQAVTGAVAALLVSFTVLAFAWRTPRFTTPPGEAGLALPAPLSSLLDSPVVAWAARAFGLAFAAYCTWALIAGPDNLANPIFRVVFVVIWVGVPLLSVLIGGFYRAINPVRTLHLLLTKVTGAGDPTAGLAKLPSAVGLWPAAVALLAFTWFELVYTEANFLYAVQTCAALYLAYVLVGAAVFGSRWIEAADPVEVFSTLLGRLSFLARDESTRPTSRPDTQPGHTPTDRTQPRWVLTNPLRHLAATPASPGLTAVAAVLLGSTAFDSFRESLTWVRLSTDLGGSMSLDTLGLLAFMTLVAALFAVATAVVGGLHDTARLAHSLLPIVAGYFVAHYLTYLIENGQQALIQLSDPLVTGANLLGTADLQVNFWLSANPTVLAIIKVMAIVIGHIVGVISAHDRSVEILPAGRTVSGQVPLLLVMVAFTIGGLTLLLTV